MDTYSPLMDSGEDDVYDPDFAIVVFEGNKVKSVRGEFVDCDDDKIGINWDLAQSALDKHGLIVFEGSQYQQLLKRLAENDITTHSCGRGVCIEDELSYCDHDECRRIQGWTCCSKIIALDRQNKQAVERLNDELYGCAHHKDMFQQYGKSDFAFVAIFQCGVRIFGMPSDKGLYYLRDGVQVKYTFGRYMEFISKNYIGICCCESLCEAACNFGGPSDSDPIYEFTNAKEED